jgi:hypothetical protein
MPLKRKTRDLELARRHLDAARKRCERQRARVARQLSEGRSSVRAQALLSALEKRELHARNYMEAFQGWHRKHPYVHVAKSVKNRLLNRRLQGGAKADKVSKWDEDVRAALDGHRYVAEGMKTGDWNRILSNGYGPGEG